MKKTNFLIALLALFELVPFAVEAQDMDASGGDFSTFHAVEKQIKAAPQAMAQIPDELIQNGKVQVATSPDGNLRIFSFDLFTGGSLQEFQNIIQYKENGQVHNFFGTIDRMSTGEKNGVEMNDGANFVAVRQVKLPSGKQLYMLFDRTKLSNDAVGRSVCGFVFKQAKPQPYNCFMRELDVPDIPKEEMMQSHVSVSYSLYGLSDIYPVANAEERVMCMTPDNLQIYQAEVENERLTGRYIVYEFDGKRYNYAGRDGGFWLHPSLRNYKSTELEFTTEKFHVCVDRLSDGSLRYASWKVGVPQSNKPDLVLFDGKEHFESNLVYQFHSGAIYYEIWDTEGDRFFRVLQGKKVLLEQPFQYM